jgi:exonuclease III
MASNFSSSCLSVCSYNCRSFKTSLPSVHNLCCQHDIKLLQEHWLVPNDLHLLNNAPEDFTSIGLSAKDLSSDILVGRPYGGPAILFRKSMANCIKIFDSNESRITGIQIETGIGPLLLLNVYMPTNYGDDSSLESYIDCLSKLHIMMIESDAIHSLIVGDFNCSPGSRFFPDFMKFANENNLLTTDLNRLKDI